MVLDLLRSGTGSVHRRLEDRLDIQTRLSSVAAYRALLMRFYGLYAGLEHPGVLHSDGLQRSKAEWLVDDLRHLEMTAEEIAGLPLFPWPEFPAAEGLGAFYVIEGSTLGGQQISQLVRQHLGAAGITPSGGGRFFSGYGERTREMWQAARNWLEEESARLSNPQGVVKGAQRTFGIFETWLCGEGDSEP